MGPAEAESAPAWPSSSASSSSTERSRATVAKRAGLPEQADADVEKPQNGWQRLLAVLGRASPPSSASGQVERLDLEQRRLRAEIEDFLAEASRSGGVVLGRGGAIVLADVPGALHVYLRGDRKARVERVMEWQGIRPRDGGPQREDPTTGPGGTTSGAPTASTGTIHSSTT